MLGGKLERMMTFGEMPGDQLGAMPAKVFDSVRANVTAGLAKLVDEVNQYAAVM